MRLADRLKRRSRLPIRGDLLLFSCLEQRTYSSEIYKLKEKLEANRRRKATLEQEDY